MTWPNPNMAAYPYNRTVMIASQYGTSPSLAQASELAMWVRSQNGEPCVIDGTGCTLTADWITAVVKGVNWRPTVAYATKWNSHIRWRGITQANRQALEQLSREYPRKL